MKCVVCGVTDETMFYGRVWNYCKVHHAKRCNLYYHENKGDILSKRLMKSYGIDEMQYQKMYKKQGGRCAICNKKHKRLHVDHNHDTGNVRQLLCLRCNTMLGMARENKAILTKAIEYLEVHNAV